MSHEMKRGLVSSALFLLLALLLAVAAVHFAAERLKRSPAGQSYPPPQIPLAVDKTLGINSDLGGLDEVDLEHHLAAIEAAGFSWLRHRFPWDTIEPEPGSFEWQRWDSIVVAAQRHNLRLVAVLDGSPAWARSEMDAANPLAPPVELRQYGAFVSAFAHRYGNQIDYYQIWDEPNIAPHWGAREVNPASYGRMLREGALNVRDADPGAVVLAAALAPNVEPGGANMSDVAFLDDLYRSGAGEWFDVVATQPYAFGRPVDAEPIPDQLNWRRPELLREVMVGHDDVSTPLWGVSFGVQESELPAEEQAISGGVTAALREARTGWPWMGPMFWAAWLPTDQHAEYGLSTDDGRLAKTQAALAGWAHQPVLAWPGFYPPNHASGEYAGEWRVTGMRADIGRTGDSLTIPFWGNRLDLAVVPGPYRAFLYATVDGVPANALPKDLDGQAYVVLYDPLGAQRSVCLAQNLEEGRHIARIEADRGWGQWAIAGWAASREAAAPSVWIPLAFLGASLLTLAAALSMAFPARHYIGALLRFYARRYRELDEWAALALATGASLLVYMLPGTVPSLAALGLLGLLLLLRPETGVMVVAFSLPFYQLGKPLLGRVLSMTEVVALLTGIGWAASRLLGGSVRQRPLRQVVSQWSAIDWGVAAFMLVGAVSLVWSDHLREAAREYRTVVLEAGLFYALIRATMSSRARGWQLADAWVLGGVLAALVGIVQWVSGLDIISADGVSRVRAFYGSPNNLALYLGRVLPLGLAVALWGRRSRRKWAYAAASAAMLLGVLLTYSRGAWLLGVPAAILFMAALRGRNSFLAAVAALVAAMAAVVVLFGPGRLFALADLSRGTSLFRLQLWRSSWAMIRDRPVLGVGLDNFLYSYRTRYVLPTAWEEFDLSHPHNMVLDVWLRMGLGGLIVLVGLLLAFFRRGWKTLRSSSALMSDTGALILGLMGSIVALVAHGLVDHSVFLVDLSFSFALVLALLQAPFDVSR